MKKAQLARITVSFEMPRSLVAGYWLWLSLRCRRDNSDWEGNEALRMFQVHRNFNGGAKGKQAPVMEASELQGGSQRLRISENENA